LLRTMTALMKMILYTLLIIIMSSLLLPCWWYSYFHLKRSAKVSWQGFERRTFWSSGLRSTIELPGQIYTDKAY
jgi:hypothetical protein